MASVIYVSNRDMIEYHRINGADEINFWRPMSQTRMKRFYPGDLLFFLTKTDVPGKKEKGIVGYGEFVRVEKRSLKSMWKTYGDKNGYPTYELLQKAIHEFTPNIPKQLSCLFLDHIVFFNQPVFPSDIGMSIPNNLESYSYLIQDGKDMTYKVLEEAQNYGVNYWSKMVGKSSANDDWFEKDLKRNRLAVVQEEIGELELTGSIKKDNKKALTILKNSDPSIKRINDRGELYYKENGEGMDLYYACMIGKRDKNKIKTLVGHLVYMATLVRKETVPYQIYVIVKDEVKEELEKEYLLPNSVHLLTV